MKKNNKNGNVISYNIVGKKLDKSEKSSGLSGLRTADHANLCDLSSNKYTQYNLKYSVCVSVSPACRLITLSVSVWVFFSTI